jgi:3-oxoacyl-[acyl-carrier protein] reductase
VETGLSGKVALVTAASKGLGRAAAESLARDGARVAIVSRNVSELEAAARAIAGASSAEVVPIVGDVTRADDIERMVGETVERFGGLDIVVGNAGGPKPGTFDTLTEADWRAAIELTLMSAVRLSMATVPHLRRRGGGRIIYITSVSVKQPVPRLMLSNSLRAAVVGFAKTLAIELAPDRILVNCVAPGYTRTERVTAIAEATARTEGVEPAAIEKRMVQEIPAGRLGEPHELGDLIAFLGSERASYITGTTIQVDGGYVRGIL